MNPHHRKPRGLTWRSPVPIPEEERRAVFAAVNRLRRVGVPDWLVDIAVAGHFNLGLPAVARIEAEGIEKGWPLGD